LSWDAAWALRPANVMTRLGGRQLLVLSARDLLAAAAAEGTLLIALVAPAPAALAGFARAARDAGAPLIVLRPSGGSEEKGPEDARDDAAFVEAALRAAEEVAFGGPMALLKDPPRTGGAEREPDRVAREIDAGFTGLALAVEGAISNDAVAAAAAVSTLELGLEVVPEGEPEAALEAVRTLGAAASAVRLTGCEERGGDVAVSTASEEAALGERGVRQLVASGPFLRALRRSAPPDLLQRLEAWAGERRTSLEAAAARYQRLLRDLPPAVQEKLEALACFEAAELYARAGVVGTAASLVAHLGAAEP